MKNILFIFIAVILANCSKPKTVLICGDHICVNKAEAEQYFEENLSLEVKIINRKEKKEPDLVELNIRENSNGKKQITLASKNNTSNKLKVLSDKEIIDIKKNINNKRAKQKKAKIKNNKKSQTKSKKITNKISNKEKLTKKVNQNEKKNVHKKKNNVVDVCTIIEKCSIEEISKYLLEQGKNKGFPDITKRQ